MPVIEKASRMMTAGNTFSIASVPTPAPTAPSAASPTAAPSKSTAKGGAALAQLMKQLEVRRTVVAQLAA
jgi:hypothetical protein